MHCQRPSLEPNPQAHLNSPNQQLGYCQKLHPVQLRPTNVKATVRGYIQFEFAQPVSRPLSGAISSLNSPTAAHRLCPGKGRAVPPRGNCLQQLERSFISKGTRVWTAPQPIQQQACWAKHLDSAWATPTDFAKLPISAHSMPPSCLGLVVSKGARQPTCCHQCSHVTVVTPAPSYILTLKNSKFLTLRHTPHITASLLSAAPLFLLSSFFISLTGHSRGN
jgi:hypothetical protein